MKMLVDLSSFTFFLYCPAFAAVYHHRPFSIFKRRFTLTASMMLSLARPML